MSVVSPDVLDRPPLIITHAVRDSWAKDPVKWVREVINPQKISSQQEEVLRGYGALIVARLQRRAILNGRTDVPPLTNEQEALCQKFGISIQSGKGTGKNAVVAWMILHFMDCMPPPNIKLMFTAPTEEQLKNNLWTEVYKWMMKSPYLMDVFAHTSEKIYFKAFDGKAVFATWKTCAKSADPNDQAATLAGKHEDFMLLGVDEASAVPDPVFRPIESTMTGICNLAIVTFNPTRSKGYAINTQTLDRQHWLAYHWDAEQSDVVDPLHVKRYAEKYGIDSNMYRINVRGLPPQTDADVLIPYGWVDESLSLELDVDEGDLTVAGLDVAGGGSDSTVLCVGRGGRLESIQKTNLLRKQEIADWVARQWHTNDLEAVAVDVNGLGSGVAEILQDMGMEVLFVNVGREAERNPMRFDRLRDEVWWDIREALEHGEIQLPNHEELIGELTSIKYEPYRGTNARIKVESKKEMRARGLKSPDTADAACLWNYARIRRGHKVRPSVHRRRRHHRMLRDWRGV